MSEQDIDDDEDMHMCDIPEHKIFKYMHFSPLNQYIPIPMEIDSECTTFTDHDVQRVYRNSAYVVALNKMKIEKEIQDNVKKLNDIFENY